MQHNNNIDTTQLVTSAEAGKIKGMQPNHIAYHLAKPDAPKPVFVGIERHIFYRLEDIHAWEPKRDPKKGRKNTRKGRAAGE